MMDEPDVSSHNSMSGSVNGNIVQAHNVYLVKLAAGTQSWLAGQIDPRLEVEGWHSREERLAAYVKAASEVLTEIMRTDGPFGAVSASSPVYVQQAVFGVAPGAVDGAQTRARTPAHGVLTGAGDCVLLGEPGSGKSTTLRGGALELAARWLNGYGRQWVPVLVRAGDLVGASELPTAVAAAVRTEFGAAHAAVKWSAHFFSEAPEPGSRWLVLVDGLDEVLSEAHRRQVLALLKRATTHSRSPYQVVLTSRPLAEDAFAAWPELSRYRLLKLGKDSLAVLARTRFSHAGLDHVDAAVEEFLRAVDRTGIARLSRVPLMATMLCELFIDQQRGELPRSRTELFQRYTELLHNRMYSTGVGGVLAQLHAAVSGVVGQAPAERTEVLLDLARQIIGVIALAQQEKPDQSAVALAHALTAADRPSRIPDETWRELVRETFRRTGLLSQQGGDLVFMHRYVGEFLAARQLASSLSGSWVVSHRLFGWMGERIPLLRSPFRLGEGTRKIEDQASFCRFLISEWMRRPWMRLTLYGLTFGRGLRSLHNCRLIVMLIEDGTPVPANVRNAATRALLKLATKDRSVHTRFDAAMELAKIADGRGFEFLTHCAADPAHPSQVRLSAATELARNGAPSAVSALRELITDAGLDHQTRVTAALELVRYDPEAATVPLARLAQNKSIVTVLRLQVAIELIHIDRERGQDALASLIATCHNDPARLLLVALELAKFGDLRAVDALKNLARHRDAGFGVRFSAAVELDRLKEPDAIECLRDLATSGSVQSPDRLRAALQLTKCAPEIGLDLVHGFAIEPTQEPEFRMIAATQLILRNDPRGRLAMTDLAVGLPFHNSTKFLVLGALARLRDPVAIRELALMADRRSNRDLATAEKAAKLLDQLVEVEGLDGWGGVARAADLHIDLRLDAVGRLRGIATVRARALLHELSDDAAVDVKVRLVAGLALR